LQIQRQQGKVNFHRKPCLFALVFKRLKQDCFSKKKFEVILNGGIKNMQVCRRIWKSGKHKALYVRAFFIFLEQSLRCVKKRKIGQSGQASPQYSNSD
jgi:hypothetical protein